MATPELLVFIRTHQQMGTSKDEIEKQLLAAGWQQEAVAEGFRAVGYSRKERIVSKKDGTVPSLIKKTFLVVKENWHILLALILFTAVLIGIGSVLPYITLVPLLTLLLKSHYQWYVYVGGGIGFILFSIIFSILQSWGPSAIIYRIIYRDEKPGFFMCLKRSRHKITRFWTLSLINGFIMYSMCITILSPVMLLAAASLRVPALMKTFSHVTILQLLISILLIVILVIVLILVVIWSMFSTIILVDEDIRPLDTIVKAKALSTRRIPYITSRLVLLIIPGLLTFGLVSLPSFFKMLPLTTVLAGVYFLASIVILIGVIYVTLVYEYVSDTAPDAAFIHSRRDKRAFMVLIVLGVILPVLLSIIFVTSAGPTLAPFLESAVNKAAKTNSSPIPVPTEYQKLYPSGLLQQPIPVYETK